MAANRIQLQNALHKPYDRVLFSREVLSPVFGSGFTLHSSLVPASVSPNKSESAAIANVWIYGKIQLDDSTEMTCYEVLLQPKVRIEQSKVAIQQYVRKLLTAGQAALINFVAPANKNAWRLTLVAKDSVLTDQGVKEKTTNAKRYTFLLGPSESCKTAAERFEKLSTENEITFQTLVNAFSVEKLSKAFFDEYTLHYQNFGNYLQDSNYCKSVFNIPFPAGASKQEKDKASKPIRDFVKKLLGRIVFLYFVQKKGWLGASDTHYSDGLGDFIKQLFQQSGGNDTFYSNWLTVLFFDTLNKERANDDFKMPDGKMVKVPFLNGGLFDKEEFDEHLLTFPAKLFHNPGFEDAILTAKSNGFARGFLDFLDAFNFTIYEDSPDDHTVAVDPEMLGHIFENLLEDNKDKGAFYTPKEIVHYMCQESLTEYLCTYFSHEYTNETEYRALIENVIKRKQIDTDAFRDPELLVAINKALDTVKICDPSIGSGAFPMGLLQEIFSIKELIAYKTGKPWNPAETKLNIIQNSIYGVDIEKGAVDIARLRFWLSLVVDEEKPKALPNLDYKIVVGDSLISKFDGEMVEIDWERKSSVGKADEYVQNVQRLLREVAEKQKHYFSPTNKDKKKLQAKIRNLKIELLINQLSFNKELYISKTEQKGGFMPTAADIKHNTERELQIKGFDNLINKLKNLLQHPDEPFNHFDWKLDFPEVLNPYLIPDENQRGFDVVIGNPPYIQLQKDGGKLAKEFEMQHYQTFARTGDIYALFYEKGIQLLKHEGILTYITSNKWMRAGYGEKLRVFFTQYNPLQLIDLGPGVFESATVDTNILLIQKTPTAHKQLKAVTLQKQNSTINIESQVQERAVILEKLSSDAWFIGSSAEQQLKEKIERIGKPLKDWDVNIYYGIKTGLNEAFIITTEKRDEILANCKDEAERRRTEAIIKPILRGRDIKRYHYEWAGLWVIFIPWHFPLHEDTSIQGASEKAEKEFQ
ncbi:MAG: Eco57I restriction-modification methylase domain-containing protein, partial [Microbacter sp.]